MRTQSKSIGTFRLSYYLSGHTVSDKRRRTTGKIVHRNVCMDCRDYVDKINLYVYTLIIKVDFIKGDINDGFGANKSIMRAIRY